MSHSPRCLRGKRHRKRWGWKEGVKESWGGKIGQAKAHHLWYSQCLMPVTSPTPPLWQPTWKYSSPESDRFILSLKLLFEMRAREFAWDEGDLLKLPAALEACDVLPCDESFLLEMHLHAWFVILHLCHLTKERHVNVFLHYLLKVCGQSLFMLFFWNVKKKYVKVFTKTLSWRLE